MSITDLPVFDFGAGSGEPQIPTPDDIRDRLDHVLSHVFDEFGVALPDNWDKALVLVGLTEAEENENEPLRYDPVTLGWGAVAQGVDDEGNPTHAVIPVVPHASSVRCLADFGIAFAASQGFVPGDSDSIRYTVIRITRGDMEARADAEGESMHVELFGMQATTPPVDVELVASAFAYEPTTDQEVR